MSLIIAWSVLTETYQNETFHLNGKRVKNAFLESLLRRDFGKSIETKTKIEHTKSKIKYEVINHPGELMLGSENHKTIYNDCDRKFSAQSISLCSPTTDNTHRQNFQVSYFNYFNYDVSLSKRFNCETFALRDDVDEIRRRNETESCSFSISRWERGR